MDLSQIYLKGKGGGGSRGECKSGAAVSV